MKAFVISLCTIALMIALTISNGVYINNVTNHLMSKAEELSVEDDSIYKFKKEWEKKQILIRIASSHKETHRIDEAIEILTAKSNEKSSSGFEEEKALLIEYLKQIQEDETVSLDSII